MLCSSVFADGDVWVLSAGGEVDDEDGYRLDGGVAWLPSEVTSVSARFSRANSAADLSDFSASLASLGFDRAFGPVGITGDLRWWGDPDVVESWTIGGSFYFSSEGWRAALQGELRESEFAPFDFNTVIPVRTAQGLVLVPVSGTADCGVDDTAIGLSLGHTGKAWSFALGARGYDYSGSDCDMRNLVLPPQIGQLPPISREIFRRIAARVLDTAARLIGTQLTRENGFLEYSVNAGLSYSVAEWTWGLEYFHDREEFVGFESDTLIGSVTLPVADRFDLELRAGATDTDVAGTVGFAGLTFYAYLGGG